MYMGICLTVILTVAAYSVFVSVPASVVFFLHLHASIHAICLFLDRIEEKGIAQVPASTRTGTSG